MPVMDRLIGIPNNDVNGIYYVGHTTYPKNRNGKAKSHSTVILDKDETPRPKWVDEMLFTNHEPKRIPYNHNNLKNSYIYHWDN